MTMESDRLDHHAREMARFRLRQVISAAEATMLEGRRNIKRTLIARRYYFNTEYQALMMGVDRIAGAISMDASDDSGDSRQAASFEAGAVLALTLLLDKMQDKMGGISIANAHHIAEQGHDNASLRQSMMAVGDAEGAVAAMDSPALDLVASQYCDSTGQVDSMRSGYAYIMQLAEQVLTTEERERMGHDDSDDTKQPDWNAWLRGLTKS